MTKIVTAPNEVLSKTAERFIFGNHEKQLESLLKQMEETLLSASDPKGVGLAAPQIGKSLAVFMTKPTEKSRISVYINPLIVESETSSIDKAKSKSSKGAKKLEGCLSLPNIWGEVIRASEVTLSFYDKRGVKKLKKFKGFNATIVQHEVDHLNGILFPKHVLEQKGRLYKSRKNEKNEDEFEELEI